MGFFPHNYVAIVEEKVNLYVAEFNFEAVTQNEMSIQEGDELEVVESKSGWCNAVNLKTKKKGWVPMDYIKPK
jgi:hypothetical protein